MTDREHLARILGPVLGFDPELEAKGLLSTVFPDHTRLSFLCGPDGTLNAIIIQKPVGASSQQKREPKC